MIPAQYQPYFNEATARYPSIPAGVLYGVLQTENGSWNPGLVNPDSGAIGLGQFLPDTAKGLGINPYDPRQAIIGTAQYLSQLASMFGGSIQHAVAAYNAGPHNVQVYGLEGVLQPNFAKGQTATYLQRVFSAAGQFTQGGSSESTGMPVTTTGTPSNNPILGCLPGAATAALCVVALATQVCR